MFGGFSLLGPDGEPIEAVQPRSKGAALLAYLGARPAEDPASREELLPLLWPGRPEDRARNALRVTLSRLRSDLPSGAVGGRGEERLWLDASVVASDVRRFERAVEEGRLRDALDVYRGPFLEHVHVRDARPFARWADERRGACRRRAFEAARSLGDRCREAGELAEAESAYRLALELAPLKEDAAARLVRVLAERGERADALQLHSAFGHRMQRELDLTPSREFEALAEEIRSRPDRAASATGEVASDGAEGQTGADGISVGGDGPDADRPTPGPAPWVAAVILVSLAAAGLWYGMDGSDEDSDARTTWTPDVRPNRPAVAVLPFEQVGDADGAAMIRRGLHTGVLNRLANVPGLSSVSPGAVSRYSDAGRSLTALADSLGARWIVRGETSADGDRIRVRAWLVDARTGAPEWADRFQRAFTADDLFAIQGDIAARIASALQAELTPSDEERVRRHPTADLTAYRLYEEGRGLLKQRTDSTLRRALEKFGRVVDRDSTFARARVGLADARTFLTRYGDADPDTVLGPARRAARRALQLDPGLAEAHTALGRLHYLEKDVPAALSRFERAVEMTGSYAAAYEHLGMVQLSMGRPEEALGSIRQSVDLAPLAPENRAALSWVYLATGEYERAEREGTRARQIQPDYGSEFTEDMARIHMGREPEREWARRMHASLRGVSAGDSAAARELAARWEEAGIPLLAGVLRAVLGEHGRAVEDFREAVRRTELVHDAAIIGIRYFFPERLEGFREDPRYRELLREINRDLGLGPDGSVPRAP